MSLPRGTITFLFTDVEKSTRLWEEQPEGMRSALARHDALLRQAIEQHGGYVFKTIGDAFCAAFATAPDAVSTALAAQQALRGEQTEGAHALSVRMALHTGTAEAREGDYFGQPLNRVARLLTAAHGGQILLSNATQELARDTLPDRVGLRDLGEHRLKDLTRPEHVYQLLHPHLRADFPPLRTLNECPNNLPAQLTPLVGREKEVEAVVALLRRPEVHLVTLTGPGGTGKTRLSLQTAAEIVEDYSRGVFFVPLAPVNDPDLVIPAIAQTLRIEEDAGRSFAELLKAHLGGEPMLLVLDNFEHVSTAAPQVSDLLSSCPGLKVLATSRSSLRLRGEQEFAVPPLPLPGRRPPPPVETLAQYGAVRLFIDRASAIKPDFVVNNENAPDIAEICARLDGLPLAIELAAARIKMFSPSALLTRLENRLKLLTGGARDSPARHQTLSTAIAWSYDLLDAEEQRLFRQLSVFAGGCTVEAVEAVCSGEAEAELLDSLNSLLDKSLVRQEERENGEPRFLMLETIRDYARERSAESQELPLIRERHARYYTELAEAAMLAYDVPDARQRLLWLERLHAEHDNIQVALTWAFEENPDLALRLVAAWFTGRTTERGVAAERALECIRQGGGAPSPEPGLVSAALGVAADYACGRGDFTRQKELAEQRLGLARAAGRPEHTAWALYALGKNAQIRGDIENAVACFSESVEHLRQVHAEVGIPWALVALGQAFATGNNGEAARSHYEQSLAIFQKNGDRDGVAGATAQLADLARQQREIHRAHTLFEEVARIEKELGDTRSHPWRRLQLGRLKTAEGDFPAAGVLLRESLCAFDETHGSVGENKRVGVLSSLLALGCLAAAEEQWERMAALFGAEEMQRESLHLPLALDGQEERRHHIARGKANLGEEAFLRAWSQGRALTWQQMIEYAVAPVILLPLILSERLQDSA